VWGAHNEIFRAGGQAYKILFGEEEDRGFLTYHDAWMMPGSLATGLVEDVMTPHYGNYYMGGAAPSDTMNPNPVSFLSVRGEFLVAVECDDGGVKGKEWAELGLTLCQEALSDWGVGGKTRAGYGRLLKVS
jgi:CRISPR-associated protein Cmr6